MGKWCRDIFSNILGLIGLIALIIVLILVVFRITIPVGHLDNMGIIISFIGVLATFIVIGNFAQTSRIEEQLKSQIGDIDNRVKNCEEKDKHINKTITGHTIKINQMSDQINNSIHETSKPVERKDLARFIKLFIGKERDIKKNVHLFTKLINPDSIYVVELDDETKCQIKITCMDGGDLVFVDSHAQQISTEKIRFLSGMPFDKEEFTFIYHLLNDIYPLHSEIDDDAVETREIIENNDNDINEVTT